LWEKYRQKHWNKTSSFLVPKAFSRFCLFLLPSEKAGFFVKGGYKRKLSFLKALMYKGQIEVCLEILPWKSSRVVPVWCYFDSVHEKNSTKNTSVPISIMVILFFY